MASDILQVFTGFGGGLGGKLGYVGAVLVFVFIFAIAVFAYFYYKRYGQFRCVIWEKDGFGQMVQRTDRAGIFVDKKTKNKRLFLQKSNVGLSPDNIPYIPCGGGFLSANKIVYLLRTGLKNYIFIQPKFNPHIFSFSVGEEDVNWAVNAYDRTTKTFQKKNMLEKIMPYALFATTAVIILLLFIFLFREFSVFRDLGESIKAAAVALRDAHTGTAVIP